MDNIAVIQNDMEAYGGTVLCSILTIEAFNEKGIIPDVYAFGQGREAVICQRHGKQIKFNFKRLMIKTGSKFALYRGYFKNFGMIGKKYDFVYDFSNVFPLNTNHGRYFFYIHYPEFLVLQLVEKYTKGFWKWYILPKILLFDKIQKYRLTATKIQLGCNSQFIHDSIYETTGRKVSVIYPPIRLNLFQSNQTIREGIVTVSRFSPEKRQIDQVKIAKALANAGRDINWKICGSVSSARYYEKIANYIKKEKLNNIELLPNIMLPDLINLMKRSVFYFHTMHNEHFGIATAEAIASGCVPIVHDSGGQREVVPFPELRFRTIEEAVKKTNRLIHSSDVIIKYRNLLQEHIKNFSEEKFKKEMIDIYEKAKDFP